jgi:abortive infection bacteriophage resistance protein
MKPSIKKRNVTICPKCIESLRFYRYSPLNTVVPAVVARHQGTAFFMLPPYSKPHLSFLDQLQLLEARGLGVTDAPKAAMYLERVGYYRLSPYWLPLLHEPEKFAAGAEFSDAVDLYVFDKKLRLILIDAIERIEVAIRVDVAHKISRRDIMGHRLIGCLDQSRAGRHQHNGQTSHGAWLERADQSIADSKEPVLTQFQQNFSGDLPVVMAVELWDFGTVSRLLSLTHANDRFQIAKKYQILPDTLESWVKCLNYVRNACAHHSRLWNKPLVNQPKLPTTWEAPRVQHIGADVLRQTRIYSAAAITMHFLSIINPQSTWKQKFVEHWGSFPISPKLSVANAGLFKGWESEALWQ